MAKSNKEAQLRERMNAIAKKSGTQSSDYLTARGALNDYLESQGRRTNRIPGEPINGKGGKYTPDLKTPGGILEAERKAVQINEVGPTGSSTYETAPDGTTTRTAALSPEEQAKLKGEQEIDAELLNQIKTRLAQTMARNAPGGQLIDPDFNKIDPSKFDVMAVKDALLGPEMAELEKKQAQEAENFERRLLNRGIQPGSPRAAMEMEQFKTQQASDREKLKSAAYANAGSLATANADLAKAYYTGQEGVLSQRGQQFDEQKYEYERPFADMANLNGLYRGVNWPTFSPTQSPDPATIGMGFAGLGNDLTIAQLNAKTQKDIAAKNAAAQLEAARIAAASRGAGAGDPNADSINNAPPVTATPPPEGKTRNLAGPTRGTPTIFGKRNQGFQGRFF